MKWEKYYVVNEVFDDIKKATEKTIKEMKEIEREFYRNNFEKWINYTLRHTIYSERTITKFKRYVKKMEALKEEMDKLKK